MKNKTENEKLAKSQNQPGIKEAFSGYHQSKLLVPSKTDMIQSPLLSCIGKPEAFSPLAGHGGSFILGKGPPGKSHSPGATRGHPPANKAGPPGRIIEYNNEYQLINKDQNSNYLQTLNFKIMKKQIFILVLLLALFAGMSNVFGQTCAPSAITPNAGHEYTYSTISAGTGAKYDWYVTKSTDLLSGILTSGTMFTVNGTTPYHLPGTGVSSILITWTAAAVVDGGPFYLVLRYSESSSTTPVCTVENLRVIEIKPINSFLLAFEGGTLVTGNYVATAGSNACAANVTGAALTIGTPSIALLTYGQNTLYYVATASGIIGDWYPQIHLNALGSSQTYVSAGWSSDMTGGGSFTALGTIAATGAQDLLSATPATASEAGTPILIKIVIDNVNFQTLADQAIIVGLDGFLPPTPIVPATSKSDVTSASNCTPLAAFGRTATFTINKRPAPTATPAFLGLTNP